MDDNQRVELSRTERRVGRLEVPEPYGFPRSERIDWIHDIDLQRATQKPAERTDDP